MTEPVTPPPHPRRALRWWIASTAVVVVGSIALFFLAYRGPRVVGPLVRSEPAKASVRLLLAGDTGRGGDAQMRVAAAMERRAAEVPVDGVVLLGDLSYLGCFESADDPKWQQLLLGPYGGGALARVPLYPVLGNRDVCSADAFLDRAVTTPRWRFPARGYTVDFGELLQIVVTDTNDLDRCGDPARCEADRLQAELARDQFRWRIVAGHHPIESSAWLKEQHYSGGPVATSLLPLLCGHASLYLSGHAHVLESRVASTCELALAVSGAGGEMLYDIRPEPRSDFAQAVFGFSELEVDPDAWVLRHRDATGAVLYESRKAAQGAVGSP